MFAGYPVVDMKVTVTDGSYHEVDSSEYAFIEAARVCFRNLFMQANPALLEPVMAVEAITPEEYMGVVSGSICQRRGRIDNMDEQGEYKVVRGMVPLSEMFGYSNAIRTMTSGRGSFSMHFERYEAVPFSIAEDGCTALFHSSGMACSLFSSGRLMNQPNLPDCIITRKCCFMTMYSGRSFSTLFFLC